MPSWNRANAENFAAQVVGIGRRLLGIPRLHVFALVERGIAAGVPVRVRIVSGGDEEISVRPKLHTSRVMAALPALLAESEQDFLARRVQRVSVHDKPAEPLARYLLWRIIKVNPVIGGERGIEREAEQSVFLSGFHRDGSSLRNPGGIRLPNAEPAGNFDEENVAPVPSLIDANINMLKK